jgi:GNAT superfamily N-acetyltransferase
MVPTTTHPAVHRAEQSQAGQQGRRRFRGLPERHPSFTAYVQELEALSPDTLPLHLIAEREGRALGVATLKAKVDHLVARGCSYWLSGVYVEPTSRGQGIATALCQKVVEAARTHAIETLYLQTEHLGGGLYSRLGWRRLQEHHDGGVDQVVMVKDLALKDRELRHNRAMKRTGFARRLSPDTCVPSMAQNLWGASPNARYRRSRRLGEGQGLPPRGGV